MRVRFTHACRAYYNNMGLDHQAGDIVEHADDYARYLVSSGAPVEILDDGTTGNGPTADYDPVGTIAAIQAWVGTDPDRARQAYDTEAAKADKARPTLLAALGELLGQLDATGAAE